MIDAVAERATRWVVAHGPEFAAPRAIPALTLKMRGELAMAAELWLPEPWATRALADAWRDLARPLGAAAVTSPAFATIYPPFFRAGHRDAAIERLLDDPTWLAAIPRIPLQLPIELTRRALGLPPRWPVDELVRETSPLGPHPTPGTLPTAAVYALTHTVFSLTELGAYPDRVIPADRAYLVRTLPAWLAHHRAHGELELVTELAMVAECLHLELPHDELWEELAAAQRPDGSIPPTRAATSTAFIGVYHSTLVALMAAGLARRRAPATLAR